MNAIKHLIRTYRRACERGQSLVEFALLAPVLIFLFMGMFDFGWLLHQQIQIDNAVRMGARRGAVGETTPNMINAMIGSCTFPVTGDQITVDVRDSSGASVDDNTDRTPDNLIYVAIDREDVQLITPLAGLLGGATFDLHAESEFLIE